ncbi:MAG: hypothetical protein J0H74_31510 [Chitinophagaceae bacterium]|nr:hypothetical protein [Chitinophagaceae bacterium]
MKKYYSNSRILLVCFLLVWGCSKKATDYRKFLNNTEITYPGRVSNPQVLPGNGRLMLTWRPSPDPSIAKYVVTWNGGVDSVVLPATSHNTSDTVKCVIDHLSEYSYTFFIYSYDGDGNRSVVTEIDNAQVYGDIYRGGLHNRLQDVSKPALLNPDGSVTMYFLAPLDTINVTTRVKYVNTSGDTAYAFIPANSGTISLPGFKTGTKILYQSSFIPSKYAIDTFYTTSYDTVPYVYVLCDKSLFTEVHLPNDLNAYDGNTYLARIWDGNLQTRDYPNLFHSNGSPGIPGTITFDMHKIYNNISRLEESGRPCCHNPLDFEVWGIADTTGAITSLKPDNNGWASDMTAKGWSMLKEVIRKDDGAAPYDVDINNNPIPVRFVIIRIKTVASNAGYANISQVTLWDKQ